MLDGRAPIWPVGAPKLGDYTVECEGRNEVQGLV